MCGPIYNIHCNCICRNIQYNHQVLWPKEGPADYWHWSWRRFIPNHRWLSPLLSKVPFLVQFLPQNPLHSAGRVFCLFLVIRNIVPSNTVPPSLILNVASNIVLMPPRSPCNQERYNWENILLSDLSFEQ